MITPQRLAQMASYSSTARNLVTRLLAVSGDGHAPTREALLDKLNGQIAALTQEVEDLTRELETVPSAIELAPIKLSIFITTLTETLKSLTPSQMSFQFCAEYFRLYSSSVQVAIAQAVAAEYTSRNLDVPDICNSILNHGGLDYE